jgi:hypothetical protein
MNIRFNLSSDIVLPFAIHYGKNRESRFFSAELFRESMRRKNASAVVMIDGMISIMENNGDSITAAPWPQDTAAGRSFVLSMHGRLAELPTEIRNFIASI